MSFAVPQAPQGAPSGFPRFIPRRAAASIAAGVLVFAAAWQVPDAASAGNPPAKATAKPPTPAKPAATKPAAAAKPAATPAPAKGAPTLEEARRFLETANARLLELNYRQQLAEWVQSTYITENAGRMASDAREATIAAVTGLAAEARRFEPLALPPDLARQLRLIKLSLNLPAPSDPAKRSQLSRI